MTKAVNFRERDAMVWLNEPRQWAWDGGVLSVQVEPSTDFWQRTHYGFRRDNGHVVAWHVAEDFTLELVAHTQPNARYDQAGLIVRASSECWLKASIEYEPEGDSRLGSVVTNAGFSDWATQDVPNTLTTIGLRVRRRGGDVFVDWRTVGTTEWHQMRIAHLADGEERQDVLVGLYACAPDGPGFPARFSDVRLQLESVP